jgi:hypothetical protein
MRKLNVTLVTLDGVIQDPGGFQELEEGGWGNRSLTAADVANTLGRASFRITEWL